jgi:hypothetical protein
MAGRRRALIVANGEYDNAGLQRLGSPAADADALVEVLSDRAISEFEVRVVRNETAHVVQAEIEDLCAEGQPDDVLLMHFSCHGLKDDSGGLYFAARNTRPDRLRSTAVPAQFVQQCLRQSRSRSVVLLLDCCYGGAFGQGVAVRASGDANVLDSFRGGRGRAVITASNSIEYAFEGATLASDEPAQPSVFTAALVEGLRTGEADRDEDGWIALGELYEYLFDRVRERNPKQTPSRDIEMQGELYLAKSRRRRIKPSPIPADLSAAITAENPFTRLGAVAELRRRLASDNLPVAMGAFEALKSMAATDIQHVAAAASDALGFAVVRVDVSAVRLSAPPGAVASAALRLAGPPVAREARFEASHSWIRVTETDSGAELAVTAGASGTRRGNVVVTGPTGDAVVAVEIEAVPAPEPEPVVEPEPEPVAEEPPPAGPVEPEPLVAAPPEPEPDPVPEPGPGVAAADPVAGTAGILAIAAAVFAVIGLSLDYYYSDSLAEYRPGMPGYVVIVALGAMTAGLLTLVPRTRRRIGPSLLFGVGFAALFGLLRFAGEGVVVSSEHSDPTLGAGFTFELLAHGAVVLAAVCAAVALRRDPAGGGLGAGMVRGWGAWLAIGLGAAAAAGWIIQLAVLAEEDRSVAERFAAYYVLGAVLATALPVVAAILRPLAVGCAVLGAGAVGPAGVLALTISTLEPYFYLNLVGEGIAGTALVGLVVHAVVMAVRLRRNQPNGRQP